MNRTTRSVGRNFASRPIPIPCLASPCRSTTLPIAEPYRPAGWVWFSPVAPNSERCGASPRSQKFGQDATFLSALPIGRHGHDERRIARRRFSAFAAQQFPSLPSNSASQRVICELVGKARAREGMGTLRGFPSLRVGGGGLCPTKPSAGGNGNPPRVPITSRRRRRALPDEARAREGMGTLPGFPSQLVSLRVLRKLVRIAERPLECQRYRKGSA
jgi:hypothetical protein